MANNYSVSVSVSGSSVVVDPTPLTVQPDNVGDTIVITFVPATGIQITSINGFPSSVTVDGPASNGQWTASYTALSYAATWSYFVSAGGTGNTKVHTHDPEIDNTPPG